MNKKRESMNMPPRSHLTRSFLILLILLLSQLPLGLVGPFAGQDQHEADQLAEFGVTVEQAGPAMLQGTRSGRAEEEHLHGDWSLNESKVYEGATLYLYNNITIERVTSLIIRNSSLIIMDNGFPKTINVLREATLEFYNVDMWLVNSSDLGLKEDKIDTGCAISSRGFVKMENCKFSNYTSINILESSAVLRDLELVNPLTNGLYFKSSTAELESIIITQPSQSGIYALFSELNVTGLEVSKAVYHGIELWTTNMTVAAPLQLSSDQSVIDLEEGSLFRTDQLSVRDLDYRIVDEDSRIIISTGSGEIVLTGSESGDNDGITEDIDIFLLLAIPGLLVLLILVWMNRDRFVKGSGTRDLKYQGESLESFAQSGARRAAQQKQKEDAEESKKVESPSERKDILFEFGKMALNGGEHSKALSYFRNLVSQCDDEKESYRYLLKVYERTKNDPELFKHYEKLLAPVASKKTKQKEAFFEGGKSALRGEDHKTAKEQFRSALSLCDSDVEEARYFEEIYTMVKHDRRLFTTYHSLLSPYLKKMRMRGLDLEDIPAGESSSPKVDSLVSEKKSSTKLGSAFRRAMKK